MRLTAAAPILAAALFALSACHKKAEPPPPPLVTVSHPLQREVVDWDDFVGHFEAVDSVDVRPRVSGYLQSIGFRDGEMVHAGQVLFLIDPRPYQAALDQARGQEARAEATLADARVELDRAQKLYAAHATSQQDLQTRQATVGTAQADVIAAQAAVRTAALNLGFTRVTAPLSGRASDRKVAPGNLVAADTTVLTSVVSVDPIRFLFNGSEAAYLKYQRANLAGTRTSSRSAANPVEIRIDGAPGYTVKGRMDFVDNQLDPQSGTIRGRAVAPNPNGLLSPGLFGHMRLLGSGPYRALLIPDAAVQADQARQVVDVVGPDGKVAARVVETAQLVDGLRVISKGLKPDDQVIIDGLGAAKAGTKVRTQDGRITPPDPGASPEPNPPSPGPRPDAETLTPDPSLSHARHEGAPAVVAPVPTPAK
ncbi:MAG: efflux RND transporter periplasmic adaptor subunit [Caulobacteraceae bacterium]|nr:efflux RND transporter periplasmic adaptor subunit [Caulobacter sp.]